MALTINLRNDSDLFLKVTGVYDDQVITPNSLVEDKTIQWEESNSSGSKNIACYSTVDCNTAAVTTMVIKWDNTGFYLTKGLTTGLYLQADAQFDDLHHALDIEDSVEAELCTFSSFPSNPVLNLSLKKNS